MTEQTWPGWYAKQFDRAANGDQPQVSLGESEDLRLDLELAASLSRLDMSTESRIRANLRNRLSLEDIRPRSRSMKLIHSLRQPAMVLRVTILVLTLLTFLTFANSPALAAFGRLLGYGYFSQTGFIRLDQTLLLPGPLLVEGLNRYRINLVVAGPDSTRIWVSGSSIRPETLNLENGVQLTPNRSETLAGDTMVWFFNPIPYGQSRPILVLEDGQQIPLGLVPAEEVGLAPTAVTLPSRTPSSSLGQPCLTGSAGDRICIEAAQIDNLGLHVLVELKLVSDAQKPNLLDWNLSMTIPGEAPIPLKSVLPGENPGMVSLLFAPFPIRDGDVTLKARDSTNGIPNELIFTLPKVKPSISPTPRVIQTPSDQVVPVLTPTKN